MAFRKPGTLLAFERSILAAVVPHAAEGIHGFALAQELAAASGSTTLAAHGTLYKALDRLRKRGLLEAEWEDSDIAETAGRPRRRLYRITADGVALLQASQVEDTGRGLAGATA